MIIESGMKVNQPPVSHLYQFRVAYSDTDQMGTVHHSKYANYYETARWELFRSIGIPYQKIEEAGFLLPVISMTTRFLKTAAYDSELQIKTTIEACKGVRLLISYQLFNSKNELINEAKTELAFVSAKTWKPCHPPEFVSAAIRNHQILNSKKVNND